MYIDAARIAGLNPLRLLHDGTAIALGYGLYKSDLSKSRTTNVMFVDIGHCDTQVTVAAFDEGRMKILSHSFDPNLGGRDFDDVLFKHFATQFNEKYKIDIYANTRASVRLKVSCEKVKRVLSANPEAPLSIECLIGDTDVRGVITREEFENRSSGLLDRVIVSCKLALEESGVSVDKLYTTELVGSGSRVPAITKVLTSFLEKEPMRTLNAKECVAGGCALRCAMLSRTIKVRDYKIEDSFPYAIVIPSPEEDISVFPKGSSFPRRSKKLMEYTGNIPFYLQVAYILKVAYIKGRDFPAGVSDTIGEFAIGYQPSDAEKGKIEFTMKLNKNGIVGIDCTIVRLNVLSLPLAENFYVSMTNDELIEATNKEKFLTEQDIKVENEQNAVAEVTKALQACIAKYHTLADSLPTDKKEKVKTECARAEQWLSGLSEKNLSPKILLTKINDKIDSVERKCEGNIRPETSFPRPKDPVHSNKNLEMSVIGFDIGNKSCVIAAAKQGGVDVFGDTPAVVSFGDKQRFLGFTGAAFASLNSKSTISQIKWLIGKLYKEVEEELKLLPFATREGPRGGILIELKYMKQNWSFSPVEILGMLFKHLKKVTERNLESKVVDCVIGVPSYFTDLQRRMYIDAACIADLNPLSLLHDGTAIALGYGMYKTDLSKRKPTNVMFVDIGHCDTQVTIAAFEEGRMKILSHSFDPNLGGRDFDEVLFNHFAAQFNKKYKIDIYANARASVRLRLSCEKVKRVLSANAEAPLSIECLIGDMDVRGVITRDEFENLSSGLLDRVIVPCKMALEESGLSVDKLYTTELVGSGSRVPAITRVLTSFLEKEPTRTVNTSECVARGCALRCAMLSPTIIVRDYKIEDSFPYSIVIPSPQGDNLVFPKGSSFPSKKVMVHNRNIPFYLQVTYIKERDFPAGISHKVGDFGIGSEPSDVEKGKVEFRLKLNQHGIVGIDYATVLDDKRYSSRNIFSNILLGENHVLNLPFSENLDVSITNEELDEATKKEKLLTEQDIKVEKTKDQRNTLESFVYDTRSKLSGAYRSLATDSQKDELTENLQKTEDWLYEDSDDKSEQDYTGTLQDLQKLLEPIEIRYNEQKAVAEVTKAMQACIAKYHSRADSLPTDKKEKVKTECARAEQWLSGHDEKNLSPKNLLTMINRSIYYFERNCERIMRPENPRVTAAKPLQSCIEHYYVVAESLPADKKEEVKNVCRQAEEWLQTSISQKPTSPRDVNLAISILESQCESIIRPETSFPRPKEPVHSENPRVTAAKPLQSCIEHYYVIAESLPADKKEMVINVCRQSEEWLQNFVSQKSAAPLDINQLISIVESNFRHLISSESSILSHEEPVDSKNAKTKAITDLQNSIAKYRLEADSLPADMKVEVENVCNQAEQWLMNDGFPELSSPNISSTDIINIIEIVESTFKSIISPK